MGSFVYKFIDTNNTIIYIGKTTNLDNRLKHQHFTKNGHLPNECYGETDKVYYAILTNDDEMSIYERYLINLYQPKFNILHNNGSVFQFKLPDLKWFDYEDRKNLCTISKKSNLKIKTSFNDNKYCDLNTKRHVEELIKSKRIINTKENNLKLSNLLNFAKKKEILELHHLIEIIKTLILCKNRRHYVQTIDINFFQINQLLTENNLKNPFDLYNFDLFKDQFQKYGLKLFKSGVSFKTASPVEFYNNLLELSKILNLSNIHRDWIREYSNLCDLNFTLRNSEQDKFLLENNIEISSYWYSIKEIDNHAFAI